VQLLSGETHGGRRAGLGKSGCQLTLLLNHVEVGSPEWNHAKLRAFREQTVLFYFGKRDLFRNQLSLHV
jgi:hypothetical protein